jgi:nitrogen fixation NifU-like protein
MFDDLTDLYQQVILDHCKHPRNFREMGNATHRAQGLNPLCGDQLMLFLRAEAGVVQEISFVGSGCCISKASASLLTEAARGRTRDEIKVLFDQVHDMITTGKMVDGVGKLAVFAGVHKYPARVKCAILAWHAVLAALDGQPEPVSTEKEDT